MEKYLTIAKQIKQRILSEKYQIGQKLPTQNDLATEFNTSRVTISHALNILAQQGLITTRAGEGSFISSKALGHQQIDERLSLSKVFSERLKSQIISFDIHECDEIEAEKLALPVDAPIYEIIRLRLLDEIPIHLEYTIMPVALIPGIDEKVLQFSIYDFINEKLHLEVKEAHRIFRADKADAYDIKYLQVHEHTPIFEIEQVAYLTDKKPFEFSHTRFPYDKIEFSVRTTLK